VAATSEPKALLVELGVRHEKARRKGATMIGELWTRPTLSARMSNSVTREGSAKERREHTH
jgi:hypothetical protein